MAGSSRVLLPTWEAGKVEANELSLEAVVEVNELAVAAGAEQPARNVDVEHYKLLPSLLISREKENEIRKICCSDLIGKKYKK